MNRLRSTGDFGRQTAEAFDGVDAALAKAVISVKLGLSDAWGRRAGTPGAQGFAAVWGGPNQGQKGERRISMRSAFFGLVIGALTLALIQAPRGPSHAAEVTLKLHHFLPADSVAHEKLLKPWSKKVMEESDGRIEIKLYPDMRLGGEPADLFDQVSDGVVDLAWVVPGYTPGRFPITGVFELPFMVSRAQPTSRALQRFSEQWLVEEYQAVKPLIFHVHDRGVLHLREQDLTRKESFSGLRIRAPGRAFGAALAALGASPVYLPATAVPQALRDGVIDGAALPYEVAVPLGVHETVKLHSEIYAKRGFYTTVFLLAMNKESYQALPGDLQAVIDRASGEDMASVVGQIWDDAEASAREAVMKHGNEVTVLEEIEVERLRLATAPVIQGWIEQMTINGLDGEQMLQAARGLIAEHTD